MQVSESMMENVMYNVTLKPRCAVAIHYGAQFNHQDQKDVVNLLVNGNGFDNGLNATASGTDIVIFCRGKFDEDLGPIVTVRPGQVICTDFYRYVKVFDLDDFKERFNVGDVRSRT